MTTPLPIDEKLPALLAALEAGPSAVLVAAPGAGKTTRVPLVLLGASWRGDKRIIVLEPRRLAARAAARRMAETLSEEVGETVGYRVRMDSRVGPRTRIEVVTEGIFTRMLLDDPELTGIAAVLFDEFHERSLDGDLGLALALDARALRPDLRLLVMSATLDTAAVARLLADAPVIVSEGRSFPVETRYLPPAPGVPLDVSMAAAIRHAMADDTGSILAFLPGEAEIARVGDRLAGHLPGDVDIAPLYGRLTPAEQDRAIQPARPGCRKVVLATAIAQTSLTIEGVRVVIDGGWARLPVYEPATGFTGLETRRVSRAAADQRRGRAGRTEPGICYRLWSAGQEGSFAPFDPPEILAADLSGFALELAAWGITDPAAVALLNPPPIPAWTEAVVLLRRLEAIDGKGGITKEGRALAAVPLHPRLAHMIHRAKDEGQGAGAAYLAALLTERGLGGSDVDLEERQRQFRRDRSARAQDARALARRWAPGEPGDGPIGRHLARAFPERVAQAVGQNGRFRLANGRQASIAETSPLARSPFLAVGEVSGAIAVGHIRAAAPISRAEIEEIFAEQIVEETLLAFDTPSRSIRGRRQRRLGELLLADIPVEVIANDDATRLLVRGVAEVGLASLPWAGAQLALRERSSFLRRSLGTAWPDLSDQSLTDAIESWLAPHIAGRLSIAAITPGDLERALAVLLPWAQRAEMERLLPSHFEAPTGSRLPIDYGAEGGPALHIRVQELFGGDRHPTVDDCRLQLLIVLLSPANRPIQTTSDLPGFWRGSWKDVAKDLKGRYPRHPWPDDPIAALPTTRAKPRSTAASRSPRH